MNVEGKEGERGYFLFVLMVNVQINTVSVMPGIVFLG